MKISRLPLLRLGWRWAIYLGSDLPAGVSGLVGYYVRRRWRLYRRSYALEPTGTLPGELDTMPIFHTLSRPAKMTSFRSNATRIQQIAFEQNQYLTSCGSGGPHAGRPITSIM